MSILLQRVVGLLVAIVVATSATGADVATDAPSAAADAPSAAAAAPSAAVDTPALAADARDAAVDTPSAAADVQDTAVRDAMEPLHVDAEPAAPPAEDASTARAPWVVAVPVDVAPSRASRLEGGSAMLGEAAVATPTRPESQQAPSPVEVVAPHGMLAPPVDGEVAAVRAENDDAAPPTRAARPAGAPVFVAPAPEHAPWARQLITAAALGGLVAGFLFIQFQRVHAAIAATAERRIQLALRTRSAAAVARTGATHGSRIGAPAAAKKSDRNPAMGARGASGAVRTISGPVPTAAVPTPSRGSRILATGSPAAPAVPTPTRGTRILPSTPPATPLAAPPAGVRVEEPTKTKLHLIWSDDR